MADTKVRRACVIVHIGDANETDRLEDLSRGTVRLLFLDVLSVIVHVPFSER